MKINKLGPNKTELTLHDGTVVFFSYKTPVAALIPGEGWVRTDEKYSVTTSKHINQWLAENNAEFVDTVNQHRLDALTGAL